MSIVRVGSLVRAIGETTTDVDIDYEALGIVMAVEAMVAEVKWPGVEKNVFFSINDLICMDGSSADYSKSGNTV